MTSIGPQYDDAFVGIGLADRMSLRRSSADSSVSTSMADSVLVLFSQHIIGHMIILAASLRIRSAQIPQVVLI